jgi:hypothetical protein
LLLAGCDDGDGEGSVLTAPPAATQSASTQNASVDDAIQGTVTVDFTGAPQERERIDMPFEVAAGTKAWDAIKMALGEENVSSQEFSGGLGVFITGFNGVEAEGNHFWEFKVNGETVEVGVSQYEVQQGDVLEFVYSSF